MRKLVLPMLFAGEWILFAYVLLLILLLQAISMANVVLIDMPWEEAITLTDSLMKTSSLFLLSGCVLYFYFHYLQGNRTYRLLKIWAFGFLIIMNLFGSLLWLILSLPK